MKVIRNTLYTTSGQGLMAVCRDVDLNRPIEEVLEYIGRPIPKVFFIVRVFEAPDGSSVKECTALAEKDWEEHAADEENMATLYYWDAQALTQVKPHGVLTASLPAPLTVDQIKYTLKMLAKHPNYKGQTVLVIAKDMQLVKMEGGEIA